MTDTFVFPKRKPGRQSAVAKVIYEDQVAGFCNLIHQINSRLEFRVSSRGWAYILEDYGLTKGDFDLCQNLINECRKSGALPLDITAEDASREFSGLGWIDDTDPAEEAQAIVDEMEAAHRKYHPFGFWEDKDVYIQALVEKIDLRSLFGATFSEFHIPYANAKGWSDLHSRAALMRRFRDMEADGKRCILLYCGDHDPGGLAISSFLRSNMADLGNAVGWSPDNLIIDRFGLNADFIDEHGLTWIDNLETSSGRRLDDPKHPDHRLAYVQDYLARHGVRKCEANALVTRPEVGRELCRNAILKYLNEDDPGLYRAAILPHQKQVRAEVSRLVAEVG